MSLRARLAVLATCIFLAILAVGTVLVVDSARRAVAQETQSTATLALQLLELAFADSGPGDHASLRARLIEQMKGIESARHLRIALVHDSEEQPPATPLPETRAAAPSWFVDWVRPDVTELRRVVDAGDGNPATIVVRADPADEITESWQDARTMLGLVVLFAVVANVLFFVLIGRWLGPLDAISAAMDGVQHGDYRHRLPELELPELANVAARFNRMVDVLELSREENRLLAQKTLAIQEDERRALAHELHDELGQSISAIKAVAVSINQTDAARPDDVRTAARTIAEISGRIYSVVRGMMTRLRPVLLDEFGLVPALEELIDTWNGRAVDVFCRFSAQGPFGDLSDEVRIGVYRIVQECLTNVTKHAGAAEVRVSVERRCTGHAELLVLVVADDGIGFAPGSARTGLGLLGMRERVEALNGHYSLDSGAGRGTTIRVGIPIAPMAVTS